MTSLAGHLLIAAPQMLDDFFNETVVLLFQHSPEGAAGVILNRPSDVSIRTLWNDFPHARSVGDEPIYVGGPCEGPLIAIHNSLAFAEVSILPGVSLTVEQDHLRQLLEESDQPIRLFSGYSGWGAHQLESEIEQGGWFTLPANAGFVFGDPSETWKQACARYGDDIIAGLAGSRMPSDPSLN